MRAFWRDVAAGLFGAAWVAAAAAQSMVVTLLDGEAAIVDGSRRVAAAPGLKLTPGAIVETAPGTQVLRVETADQTAVDLGPATRAMLQPPGLAARSGRLPVLYLLQGWAKVSGPGKEPAGGVLTPTLELLPFIGSAVVSAERGGASAFAEGGPLEAIDRTSGRRSGVAAGAFTSGGRVEPRPPADWLARVPRPFRDPLPRRWATLAERPFNAAVLAGPSYAQLADWLAAEPALRQDFPRRFEALAQDAAFRKELQARLPSHPEWTRVLHPERKP